MEIWIRRDGQEFGPCTLEQVKESIDNGGVTLEDEAWIEGWDDYLTVGDIPRLANPPMKYHKSHRPPLAPTSRRTVNRSNEPIKVLVELTSKDIKIHQLYAYLLVILGGIILVIGWLLDDEYGGFVWLIILGFLVMVVSLIYVIINMVRKWWHHE